MKDNSTAFVGYLRVSTERQGKSGLGIDDQKKTIENMVKNIGGHVIKWFEEHQTATGKRVRIIQNEARSYCKDNDATFIAARLDRFARDYSFCRSLFESGDPFLFCDCPTANALELNIRAVFAEEEARKISVNTKNALAVLKKRGTVLGNPKNFSNSGRHKGGETVKLQALTNSDNRKAIGFIEIMLENKNTYSTIASKLNEFGFKTSVNKPFTKYSVCRLIKLYKGFEEYKKVA
jgi:DNA invertase Pin-like site-specific DNA recombinase